MKYYNLSIAEIVLLGVYTLIGFRFAFKFLQDNLHTHSTLGDMLDLLIASVFISIGWPVLMCTKLIKEY